MFKEQLTDAFNEISPSPELLDRISAMMAEEAARKKPPLRMTAARYAGIAAAVAITAGAVIAVNNINGGKIAVSDSSAQTAAEQLTEQANGADAAYCDAAEEELPEPENNDGAMLRAADTSEDERNIVEAAAAEEEPAYGEAADTGESTAPVPADTAELTSAAESHTVTEESAEPQNMSYTEDTKEAPLLSIFAASADEDSEDNDSAYDAGEGEEMPEAALFIAEDYSFADEACAEEDEETAENNTEAAAYPEDEAGIFDMKILSDDITPPAAAGASQNSENPAAGIITDYDQYMNEQYELFREKCPMNFVEFVITDEGDGVCKAVITRDLLFDKELDISFDIRSNDDIYRQFRKGHTYAAYLPYYGKNSDLPYALSDGSLCFETEEEDGVLYAYHGNIGFLTFGSAEDLSAGSADAESYNIYDLWESEEKPDYFEHVHKYELSGLAAVFRSDWETRGFVLVPFDERDGMIPGKYDDFLLSGNTEKLVPVISELIASAEELPSGDSYPIPAGGYDIMYYFLSDGNEPGDASGFDRVYIAVSTAESRGYAEVFFRDGTVRLYALTSEYAEKLSALR